MPHEKASRPTPVPACSDPPAQRLWNLWRGGQVPDVGRFLAEAGGSCPAEIAEVLLVDQQQRWKIGRRIPAGDYLRDYPALQSDGELALDLIWRGVDRT